MRLRSHHALAGVLAAAGVAHFVVPEPFEEIIPAPLRDHDTLLTYASGVAELACAAGLLPAKTRRAAALATALLFVLVFPANVQMALDGGGDRVPAWAAWARLPLQVPLLVWAIRIASRRSAS
ncbi:MAG TPA: hypothetical protein VEA78_12540 [Acidimicrobiales bacterium]|nr:hypothetical protein [Acidimicrobiales bacterium]